MNGDIIRILQSDPGFTGYIPRARGLWVAPFVALLLYILFLLIKYFVSLFDTSASGREGGWYGQAGRKSSSRLPFMSQRGSNVPPPPPPPAAAGGMQQQPQFAAGSETGNGVGTAAGGYGPAPWAADQMTQGVESEKGLPGEGRWNQGLGRAADVMRLAFLFLLGGAAITNFSFDVRPGSNALIWTSFGLFVVWALIALFTPARWVPALMGLLTFPVVIALYSIAFETY